MHESGAVALNRSVSRTFIVLVAPILNTLGWDLATPEYWFIPQNGNDADARMVHYMRLESAGNRPMIAVETRALGSDITDGIEFHLRKSSSLGIAEFAVTDGRKWHLYPILQSTRVGEPSAVCDLFSGDTANIAAMTMLRYPRRATDNGVKHWIPLPEYDIKRLDKPAEIMFPDGSVSQRLRHVYDVQRYVVRWLHSTSRLSADMCPIQTRRGAMLVNATPVNASGKPFKNYAQTDGELYVNTSRDAIGNQRAAIDIIKAVGLKAVEFKCRPFV